MTKSETRLGEGVLFNTFQVRYTEQGQQVVNLILANALCAITGYPSVYLCIQRLVPGHAGQLFRTTLRQCQNLGRRMLGRDDDGCRRVSGNVAGEN